MTRPTDGWDLTPAGHTFPHTHQVDLTTADPGVVALQLDAAQGVLVPNLGWQQLMVAECAHYAHGLHLPRLIWRYGWYQAACTCGRRRLSTCPHAQWVRSWIAYDHALCHVLSPPVTARRPAAPGWNSSSGSRTARRSGWWPPATTASTSDTPGIPSSTATRSATTRSRSWPTITRSGGAATGWPGTGRPSWPATASATDARWTTARRGASSGASTAVTRRRGCTHRAGGGDARAHRATPGPATHRPTNAATASPEPSPPTGQPASKGQAHPATPRPERQSLETTRATTAATASCRSCRGRDQIGRPAACGTRAPVHANHFAPREIHC